MTEANDATVELLDKFLAAFNRHDLDTIMNMFSDNCTLDMPRGPEPHGRRSVAKEQVREAMAGRFSGLPDVHYGDALNWVSGCRGVSQWLLTGTTRSGRENCYEVKKAAGLKGPRPSNQHLPIRGENLCKLIRRKISKPFGRWDDGGRPERWVETMGDQASDGVTQNERAECDDDECNCCAHRSWPE